MQTFHPLPKWVLEWVLLTVVCSAGPFLAASGQIKFAVRAGGSASDFTYQQNPAQGSSTNQIKPGFTGGIQLDIPVDSISKSCLLRVAPELFFLQNGAINQYYASGPAAVNDLYSNKFNFNYMGLYLPVKLSLQAARSGVALFALAGGYFDYIVSSTLNGSGADSGGIVFPGSGDKMDFGFRGALGVSFPVKEKGANVCVELGYNLGLNNIRFYTNSNPALYRVNNNCITLSVVTAF
jgi:hypothetical protein